MPAGRPKVARDNKIKARVVEFFEQHLTPKKGSAARRAPLFIYPEGRETVHKAKLQKQLPFVYGLCALTARKLSGPMQVQALLEWNTKHRYVPHHGSKAWAQAEICKLFAMEMDLCKVSALGETEWADLVGDVKKYPRLEVTDQDVEELDTQTPSETPLDEDSAEQPVPVQPYLEEQITLRQLPSFMCQDLEEMGVTVDRVSDTSESAKGSDVLSLPSEPGTVPKALNDPETGTGGQPYTKSACTEQTNTKDSEAPEANTSPEDLAAHAREVCISTLETLRIENNCPCYTDSENNIVVGTFIDTPSDDGMAQAEFTDTAGTKQIVELPFLTYKEYKDESATYCKPKSKRKGLSKNRRRLFSKGKVISKKTGKVTGKVAKKPAAHQTGPTDFGSPAKTARPTKRLRVDQDVTEAGTRAHGEAGTKPFRPHQYFLLKRPVGMDVLQAKKAWTAMSVKEKSQYGVDTWQARKERKLD